MHDEWNTPIKIIDIVKNVFGGEIDLDPCTNPLAQSRIQARSYYTAEEDGLAEGRLWVGNVFCNPPYSRGNPEKMIKRIRFSMYNGGLESIIVLVNGATDTAWYHDLLELMDLLCIVRGRLKFWTKHGIGSSPRYTNHIFYFGSHGVSFRREFSEIGKVVPL